MNQNTALMNVNASLEAINMDYRNCYDYVQPMINTVYHYYPSWGCWHTPSKIEQAFKIVGKLMEKKMIKLETVKDFVTAVNNVAELL